MCGSVRFSAASIKSHNHSVQKRAKQITAVKKEVIDALSYIDSQHIAKLYETGIYNGRTYEIITYFRNGSLQGKRFTLDGLKKQLSHRSMRR